MIVSFKPNMALTWTNTLTNGIVQVQSTQSLAGGGWKPFAYDLATNSLRTVPVPTNAASAAFYRVGVSTNIPDPSLVLYLPFDNDFTNSGLILDVSGYGNHARRYSLTNWPSQIPGPDGSMAGRFHRVGTFEGGGDYAGVPWSNTTPFYRLTNGTVMAWAYYTTNSYGASVIMDASGYEPAYSWWLGRNYNFRTGLLIVQTNGSYYYGAAYPDEAANYDTGGWHHYGATWDGTNFVGYFNGVAFSTNSQAGIPALILGGHAWAQWLGIGCKTHDGTPQVDGDGYPNNAWMDGGIDEIRIYNRALSAGEILQLYQGTKK